MDYFKCKVAYVVADLKRIGPTNQTLNIIRYSDSIQNCVVFTLFDECEDTQIEEYRKYGIEVICLHMTRKSVLLRGPKALRKAIKNSKSQIVHSWGTFADIVTYYACKQLQVKHMLTLRNFPIEEMTTRMNYFVGFLVANLDLHIIKKCKHVVTCSDALKKKMENTYHFTHLCSIQNGVDFNKFKLQDRNTIRKQLNIADDTIVFIATGSMIPRKHITETADAFILATKSSNMQLWFLGDGNMLEKYREKYKANKEIVFWGKKSNVAYYLSAADVFVSSSESEGMPNAVLEALACGLPVYLSDIPQHLEILETVTECGQAYHLGNVKELSKLFHQTTEIEINKYKENTAKLFTSALTMENMGKKYKKYYEMLSN